MVGQILKRSNKPNWKLSNFFIFLIQKLKEIELDGFGFGLQFLNQINRWIDMFS